MNPLNNNFPGKMSEGTSLEDIETGNVPHTADDAVMNAILSDMNAVEDATPAPVYIPPPPPPQQPPMQAMPSAMPTSMPHMNEHPMYNPFPGSTHATMFPQQQQHSQSMYEPVHEVKQQQVITELKKNTWSVLFDELREPIFVGLLVTFFSLPALHTWLSKHMSWAYKVGGSLSWIGFLLQFSIVAGIFVTFRQILRTLEISHY